jgi:hypothetical protein
MCGTETILIYFSELELDILHKYKVTTDNGKIHSYILQLFEGGFSWFL